MKPLVFTRSEQGVTTGIEKFTPEAAHNALQSDFVNRKLAEHIVAKYVSAMNRGQWSIGQPLIFDERGALIDGQHRLLAVIRSGTTQTFTVIRGVPRDTAGHIDIGKSRSPQDVLRMKGVKNATAVAAMTRIILGMECGVAHPWEIREMSELITLDDILQRVRDDELIESIAAEIAGGKKFLSRMIKSTGASGWFLYCMRVGMTERAAISEDFLNILSGERVATNSSDPAHLLRVRLTKPEGSTSKTPPIMRLALTIKAWNAFVNSQQLQSLFYRGVGSAAEAFPRPILDVEVAAAGYARGNN